MKRPSIALVHDWLDAPGGGEALLASLLELFPGAPVFTLVDYLSDAERERLSAPSIHTSWLQQMPAAKRWFRYAAATLPSLIEGLDTSAYDVIISDCHAVAKGVRKHPGQLHVCYCHSPARFAWAMASTYRDRAASGRALRKAIVQRAQARFRRWDVEASRGVDYFIANSRHIAQAVHSCYGRTAAVIYPPVDVHRFATVGYGQRDGYVTVSRLVAYKRIDVLVEAFRAMPERRLLVIGDGPEARLLARDVPCNVTFAGRLDDEQTARALGAARGFVFAAHEDFGIATVEAQAAGTPVIAYRIGGSSETVNDIGSPRPTGMLFDEQSPAALIDAITRFECATIRADDCRANAARFATARFRSEFAAHFEVLLARWHRRNRTAGR
jgi:glycosyltransferase involved in cell wall biosynthesis